MDRGAWQAIVRGIAKSWTWLSDTGVELDKPISEAHREVWAGDKILREIS